MTVYKAYQSLPEIMKLFWKDKDKDYILNIIKKTCYFKNGNWVSKFDNSIVCSLFREMKLVDLIENIPEEIYILTDKLCITSEPDSKTYLLYDYQDKNDFVLEVNSNSSYPVESCWFTPTTKNEAIINAISTYSILEDNLLYHSRLYNIDIRETEVKVTLQIRIKETNELHLRTFNYPIKLKEKYKSTNKFDNIQEVLNDKTKFH